MPKLLTAEIEGQTLPVDLAAVTALDGLLYRQATGEDLDARLTAMMLTAPDDAAGWPLVERGVIKWLAARQLGIADATLAAVLSTVTFLPVDPPPDEGAGVVAASEVG